MATNVVNNQDTTRYEIQIDGDTAGYAEYRIDGDTIVFTHTVVDTKRREKGLGSQLVEAAVADVKNNTNYTIVAQCPFVAHWLEENPA